MANAMVPDKQFEDKMYYEHECIEVIVLNLSEDAKEILSVKKVMQIIEL